MLHLQNFGQTDSAIQTLNEGALKLAQNKAKAMGIDPKQAKAYTKFDHNFLSDWTAQDKKNLLGFNFQALNQEVKAIKLSKQAKLAGKQGDEVMVDLSKEEIVLNAQTSDSATPDLPVLPPTAS